MVPPPRTILNGIKKLPPATVAVLKPDGTFEETCYWDLNFGARDDQKGFTETDWCEATLEVMRRAVKRRSG